MFRLLDEVKSKCDLARSTAVDMRRTIKSRIIELVEFLWFLLCALPHQTANEVITNIHDVKSSLSASINSYLSWCFPVRVVASLLFHLLYFWNVTLPLMIWGYVWSGVLVCCRRSFHARELIRHASAIFTIVRRFLEKTANTKFQDIFTNSSQTLSEIVATILQPTPTATACDPVEGGEEADEPEVIAYEEFDVHEDCTFDARRISGMHHRIPRNPFRATISRNRTCSSVNTATGTSNSCYGTVTPTSYPPTPSKRVAMIHRCADKVDSVMFAVRDKLRRATQSISRDEYSRHAAAEAEMCGHFAMFDPKQTSEGLASTCGHHCVLKIGSGLVSSARSMLAVRRNTYVYFEYSITVSGAQVPSLAIGLSTKECPLNVMVGSWPHSVGFASGGLLTVGSREFTTCSRASNPDEITAGSVVGLLVYLPDIPSQRKESGDSATDAEGSPPSACTATTSTAVWSLRGSNTRGTPLLRMNVNGQQTQFAPDAMLAAEEELMLAVGSAPMIPLANNSLTNADNGANFSSATAATSATSSTSKLAKRLSPSPFYPMVSLLSPNTRLWCRFCESDIVFRTRHSIGAPDGVRVYCLDGTLLLQEDE